MKNFCKKCGKAHAPKCDRCGSTRDLRSYHGPCGKCAFEETKTAAFLDELIIIDKEKMAWSPMPAIQGVGQWAAHNLGPSGLKRNYLGMTKNLGHAAAAMTNPKRALREGWQATFRPGGQPLPAGGKALLGLSAAMDAHAVAAKEDPTGLGRSRLHRLTTALGSQVGGLMAAPYGLVAPMITSEIGARIGSGVGRTVDRMRGYHPHALPPPTGLQR